MRSNNAKTDFFRVGGTLHLGDPSYVRRPADDELFHLTRTRQFCYVLTPRQMGKSSLMIRTAARLREEGVRTAVVDLSALGAQVTAEQWYLGIVRRLVTELQLPLAPERWWQERSDQGVVQRFTDFLHDVLLAGILSPIVIFVDEIDSTLRLDFTDDFFAAIRVMYNLRASDHIYERLTFVLLGVASPTDLIGDRRRTPFNIGHSVDLREFTRHDAQPLEEGLEFHLPGQSRQVLDRVFFWTNGHPYLTQRLCLEIVQSPQQVWTDQDIDKVVGRVFFSEADGKDANLQFVRSNVDASPERRDLLSLYRRVYQGKDIQEDKRSAAQNRLRLIGLVTSRDGVLRVRNEIYRRVFDSAWIRENTPVEWTRAVTAIAAVVSILAIVVVLWLLQQQKAARISGLVSAFESFSSADARLGIMIDLCAESRNDAIRLFAYLPIEQQVAMFPAHQGAYANPHQATRVVKVVECLRPSLCEEADRAAVDEDLLVAICRALPGPYHANQPVFQCVCGVEGEGGKTR